MTKLKFPYVREDELSMDQGSRKRKQIEVMQFFDEISSRHRLSDTESVVQEKSENHKIEIFHNLSSNTERTSDPASLQPSGSNHSNDNRVSSLAYRNNVAKNQNFNINIALQMSTEVSSKNYSSACRKISEYFHLKKRINRKPPRQQSVVLNLQKFNQSNANNNCTHNFTEILKSGKEFEMGSDNSEYSVPTRELFVENKFACDSSTQNKSLMFENEKTFRKVNQFDEKTTRQSTLDDFFSEKYKHLDYTSNIDRNNHISYERLKKLYKLPIDSILKTSLSYRDSERVKNSSLEPENHSTNAIESVTGVRHSDSKESELDSVLSVLPCEIFSKEKIDFYHRNDRNKNSSITNKRKTKKTIVISTNNKFRRRTLYDYFMKKHGIIHENNAELNERKNSDYSLENIRQIGGMCPRSWRSDYKEQLENSEVRNPNCIEQNNIKNSMDFCDSFENKNYPSNRLEYNQSDMSISNLNQDNDNYERIEGKQDIAHDTNITKDYTLRKVVALEKYLEIASHLENSEKIHRNKENNENKLLKAIKISDPREENKKMLLSGNQLYIDPRNPVKSRAIALNDSTNYNDENNEARYKKYKNSQDETMACTNVEIPSPQQYTDTVHHSPARESINIDPECRQYLKDLLDFDYTSTSQENICCVGTKDRMEMTSNHICSEEKNTNDVWEKSISQYAEGYLENSSTESLSHNVPDRSFPSDETHTHDGSKVFQYILSQDYVLSGSLVNGAIDNMNNLSQKIIEKTNSIRDNNKNSNKLLQMALNIYSQHKEQLNLSQVSLDNIEPIRKFKVIRQYDKDVGIYKIIQSCHESKDEDTKTSKSSLWTNDILTGSLSESDAKIWFGLKYICADNSYLYDENNDGSIHGMRNKFDLLQNIEKIFEEVLHDFQRQRSPCLEIRKQTFQDCVFINGRLEPKSEEKPKMIKVKYESTSSQFKFCLIMFVLAKILHSLKTNTKITKRELYYQVKHLTLNQSQIDRAVRAISYMFCVGPWEFNIIANKGMVFGDLQIIMSSNEVVNCNLSGTLIPQDVNEITELRSSAFFILVVEKESIFYKLLEEDLPNKLVRPFIMITGKGFPDLNTQLFLKKLWMVMKIPIFILTDADPHGISIMMTYRFGSLANAHLSKQLVVPKANWMGVFPSEVLKLDTEKQALTETEKNLLHNLLKTPFVTIHKKIEMELQFMVKSGYKAGIEGLIKNNAFLSEFYFPLKFHNKDLI